uniref:Protein kinase domain-containing protein n=1 Tax=Rhizophagus irregularis (strain DAOM 181602 / DAOM 197198 / MUCL 43194) TaxID=747089 RepID=U9TKZ1_RHIID
MPSPCKRCGEKYIYTHNANNEWCKPCQINDLKNKFLSWSDNEKIDDFIQEMQNKIVDYHDIIFEWIPFNQFRDIKEIVKNDFITFYSAIWEDGPLNYDNNGYERKRNKKVFLKCLYNSLYIINEFLNEVKTYSIKKQGDIPKIFGISQDLDTKEYIMVLDDEYCEKCDESLDEYRWCKSCQINYLEKIFTNLSGNEVIDDFVHGMRLKMESSYESVFEWIPYDQFDDIKEISKDNFNTIYLAKWRDGQLYYHDRWFRKPDSKIILKYLHNSQNYTTEFLNNEVKDYSLDKLDGVLGISQDPSTNDYIIVFQYYHCEKCGKRYTNGQDMNFKWCTSCQINYLEKNFTNWSSGNEEIDGLIQKMQLKIDSMFDKVFEWIPYNQFSNIDEVEEGEFSAIWKDGPLIFDYDKKEWIRKSDKKVGLKYLYDSQSNIGEFLNEAKAYLEDELEDIEIHGISQDPNTNDYIIVLWQNDSYESCEKCGEEYLNEFNEDNKWCRKCQMDEINNNFLDWSGDERIDNFIQELQYKIDDPINNIIFEWIPYNQFSNIKLIGEGGFAVVYSAIWRDGLLKYSNNKWTRTSNTKVALKYLHNSQNISDGFLNEIKAYSNNLEFKVLKIYGLSQDPNTKNYVMILEYAEGRNFYDWMINS